MNVVERGVRRFDRYQQRHPVLAIPIAVMQKYGNDQAGGKAVLIAYYGLFALFPLLLLMATVLGFVLAGHPAVQHRLLSSALGNFPIISTQLQSDTHALKGSVLAVVVGSLGTIYGAQGSWAVGRQRDEHGLERAVQVVAELLRTPAARLLLACCAWTCDRWHHDAGWLRYHMAAWSARLVLDDGCLVSHQPRRVLHHLQSADERAGRLARHLARRRACDSVLGSAADRRRLLRAATHWRTRTQRTASSRSSSACSRGCSSPRS